MIQGVEDHLRLRLDALEARGQRVLSLRMRRATLSRAIAWAAPASMIGATAVFVVGFWLRWPVLLALIVVVTPPLIAAGLAYGLARRQTPAGRSAALALIDHRLDMKDRLQTSDEFGHVVQRSPFQEAALQEAAPWLDRAANAPADETPPMPRPALRLLIWPAAALCLLALTFVMPQWASSHSMTTTRPAVSGAPAGADAASASGRSETETTGATAGVRQGDGQSAVQQSGQDGGGLMGALRRIAAAFSPDRGSAAGVRDRAASAGAAGDASASGGASAGQGAKGAAGQGRSQTAGGQPGDEKQAPSDGSNAGKAAEEDDAGASTGGQASSPPGGRQDAPSARQSDPQRAESDGGQGGEGRQPGGRSRRSEQNGDGRDQAGGQGEPGQRTGEDAGAKKGRGVSSLLLATPMQDRLTGMASPGRISTTTRDGAPQGFPVTPGQAGDRGVARGEAGRTGARTLTPHDQRLARDYFTERNGGGR
ncbi:hypothetical protein SH203_00027 [Brevundimonas sp. SH203]|uniref:hypothetical protein n=1 Tax=Brevundimonas sp. SH203 TaxID=345167 RepID=UPI0009D320B7|nr:hypothetical protein [Brevundimonas sp. SH203]GAW39652.1 hypothetical protein SH203_00027 [Brevundimonas sp. SH203]